ncbi:monofunctional biosynthetic peptidoglycan transglycosylase [Solimonas soli]|uniref:monofunctional biosynthetic peptidoglycan transglycosylase n=1 Tax=Solimonas soli TaxID=413479 RepID=UPI0004B60297|nr:monofunctional biosynthetic peptidoglycan transglycosylase [Solimonas soli]
MSRRLWPRLLLWSIAAVLALTVLPVALLRFLPPPTTSYMLQSPVKPVQYHWMPASRISDNARRAVVAAEDQKFWTHNGFDLEAIEKAREHNKRSKRIRGASTISQQTAKNLFLWPGGGYFRKGVEAGYTVLIEALWPKARILEMYLNVAEFGPGIYGVEAASQAYFHKPAAKLTASEAARLAAVLPSPRHWSVTRPGGYVQRRVGWIVGQMGSGGRAPSVEPEPEIPDELQRQIDAEDEGRNDEPAAAPGANEIAPATALEPDDEPLPPPDLPAPTPAGPAPAETAPPPDGAPPAADTSR